MPIPISTNKSIISQQKKAPCTDCDEKAKATAASKISIQPTNVGKAAAAVVAQASTPLIRGPAVSIQSSRATVARTPNLPAAATKLQVTNVGEKPVVPALIVEESTPAQVVQVTAPALKFASIMDEVVSQSYLAMDDIEVLNQTPKTREAMTLQEPRQTLSPTPGSANDAGPPAGATSTGGAASTVDSAPDLNKPEMPVGTMDVAEDAIGSVGAPRQSAGLGASLIGAVVGAVLGGPLGAAGGALLGSWLNSKQKKGDASTQGGEPARVVYGDYRDEVGPDGLPLYK